jgi:hypothetical protein
MTRCYHGLHSDVALPPVVSLQNNLDTLQQWEKDWLMAFNPDKCEVIRITNKKKIIDAKYTIHGQVLHETN